MNFLRIFSKILMLLPVGTLIYDLVNGWFVKNNVQLRTVQEWAASMGPSMPQTVREVLQGISAPFAEKVLSTPASLVLLAPPVFFYLLYRLIFAIKGKSGGYSSRD